MKEFNVLTQVQFDKMCKTGKLSQLIKKKKKLNQEIKNINNIVSSIYTTEYFNEKINNLGKKYNLWFDINVCRDFYFRRSLPTEKKNEVSVGFLKSNDGKNYVFTIDPDNYIGEYEEVLFSHKIKSWETFDEFIERMDVELCKVYNYYEINFKGRKNEK
jgi:hypothetical protein